MAATEPSIRLATVKDLEELALMNQRAFISSPPQTFLARLNAPLTTEIKDKAYRENQAEFLKFFIRRSWSLNARITVVVLTVKDGREKIVASAIWRPPIAPGAPNAPSTISALRMGLFTVLRRWGFGVMGARYMSMLLREGFAHAQGATFTLEATTPGSRDVYQHFGFEVVREVIVAKGKVDTKGVLAPKDSAAATGFPIYPMIKAKQ
ncbi:hypothetical protein V5O48_012171 [Marasmius crinis-equi]|uniref:N-acetyltransferase domain-containing protein n=1 Tax=Marasmius crinis-equi TaxID=585013 RepID=A0ABR3F3K5_9AGAR